MIGSNSLSFPVILTLLCWSFIQVESMTGGTLATSNEFKFLVHIEFENYGKKCTGSIFNSTTIITAAHCLVDENMYFKTGRVKITAGTNNLQSTENPGIVRYAKTMMAFSIFKDMRGYYEYDFGALQLAEALDLSDERLESLQVTRQVNINRKYRKKKLELASFDSSSGRVQKAELVYSENCVEGLPVQQTFELCARVRSEPGKSIVMCKGDDDGAPVIRDNHVLVGILSNYDTACNENSPSFVTFAIHVDYFYLLFNPTDQTDVWKKTADQAGYFKRSRKDKPFYRAWTAAEIEEFENTGRI